jgi:hypothetical protein
VKFTLPRSKIGTFGVPYRQVNGKLENGIAALFSSQARQVQIRHGSRERTVNIIDVTPTSRQAGVSQPKPYCSPRAMTAAIQYGYLTPNKEVKNRPYANCALTRRIFHLAFAEVQLNAVFASCHTCC